MAEVSNSILTSVKKSLGIDEWLDVFDPDIIMFINSTFSTLRQVGFGPDNGFSISDNSTTWNDYYGDTDDYQFVKDYIYSRVRLMFDPPANSFGISALEKHSEELLWRINVEFENKDRPYEDNTKLSEIDRDL